METSRRKNQQVQALGNVSMLLEGAMPSTLQAGTMPRVHPAFGTRPTFYLPPAASICRPDDMLSSPLAQHIFDYEPPREFVILAFVMFDGFGDPYDQMLHYN